MLTLSRSPFRIFRGSHGRSAETQPARHALRARLLALDFPAFAHCVAQLLERIGYADVRPVSRRVTKAGTRGGYDLTASVRVGPHRRPVIVRLKQYDKEAVSQRMVDELRGAALRSGASEAVLVTTSSLSPTIRRDLVQSSPLVPVRLLDGETLLDLLLTHHVGVNEEGSESAPAASSAGRTKQALLNRPRRAIVPRSSKTPSMFPLPGTTSRSVSPKGYSGHSGYGGGTNARFARPFSSALPGVRVTVEVGGDLGGRMGTDGRTWPLAPGR
jgi:hypothetical protein